MRQNNHQLQQASRERVKIDNINYETTTSMSLAGKQRIHNLLNSVSKLYEMIHTDFANYEKSVHNRL